MNWNVPSRGRVARLVALAALASSIIAPAADAAAPLGHGIGLSQRAAAERARAGHDSARILTFYYPGTLAEIAQPATVRVWFYDRASFHIASAPSLPTGADVVAARGKIVVSGIAQPGPSWTLTGPVCLRSCYRGDLVVTVRRGVLHVLNHVPMEQYLRSVLPSEMPPSWPTAALEAQSIAARTYALYSMRADRDWDVYQDTRSQAYWGMSSETPATDAVVLSTAGKIRTWQGKPITAMYSAGNGGRTKGVKGFPYLVSRVDLFDRQAARTWR